MNEPAPHPASQKHYRAPSSSPDAREGSTASLFLLLAIVVPVLGFLGWMIFQQVRPLIMPDSAPIQASPASTPAGEPAAQASAPQQGVSSSDPWMELQSLKERLAQSPSDEALREALVGVCLEILKTIHEQYDHGALNAAMDWEDRLNTLMPASGGITGVQTDIRFLSRQARYLQTPSGNAVLISGEATPTRPLRGIVLRAVLKGEDKQPLAVQFSIAGNILPDPASANATDTRLAGTFLDPAPLDAPLATGDRVEFMFLFPPLGEDVGAVNMAPFLTVR